MIILKINFLQKIFYTEHKVLKESAWVTVTCQYVLFAFTSLFGLNGSFYTVFDEQYHIGGSYSAESASNLSVAEGRGHCLSLGVLGAALWFLGWTCCRVL